MRKGFTLIELLVVIGMIAMLTGAIGSSVSQARNRARLAKATAEVKQMTNAILAYENYDPNHQLDVMDGVEADESVLGFILGKGGTDSSGNAIPVLFNAAISSDGKIRDPWGNPYRVTIADEGNVGTVQGNLNYQTGYYFPNYNRLSVGERNQ